MKNRNKNYEANLAGRRLVSVENEIGTPKIWDPVAGAVRMAKEVFNPRVIVLTDVGSVRGKFRYFLLFAARREVSLARVYISGKFRRAAKEFFGGEVEVEEVEVGKRSALATVLIPPVIAPVDYIDSVIALLGGQSLFYNHFLITNAKKPSARMISRYLADLDNGRLGG
jgi:hypothetical protein